MAIAHRMKQLGRAEAELSAACWAMASVKSELRVPFATLAEEHRAAAAELGVAGRVTWTGGIGEAALVDLYACALGIVFPPFDEDYGYITLEAFLSRKPVVTTTDAGGPLEFVEDNVTGLVADPSPESIGAAVNRLADDRRFAQSLGDSGYDRVRAITWDGVVDRLMANGR